LKFRIPPNIYQTIDTLLPHTLLPRYNHLHFSPKILSYPTIMAANLTVHVTNISGETDDKEIKDFFSFW
jgi:hypothetical protein